MARFDVQQRFYKNVPANTTLFDDYIPANGEELFLINIGLSSSQDPNTAATILWDATGTPEVIMSSYSEAHLREVEVQLSGDGVKVLRISLTNDLNESAYMGGYIQAVQL